MSWPPRVAPRLLSGLLGVVAGTLWPTPAEAHLVTTGLGPIYDGISHLLLSPEDLVPVLAIASLAGLNGAPAGRRVLFTLTVAWLAGGLAGYFTGGFVRPAGLPAVSFLVIGGLTAADRRLSSAVLGVLALAVGLVHGWINGAAIADAGREALSLVGIVTTVFLLLALGSGFVVSRRAAWARLVARIAGSWVAAIGLLMLGWSMRGVS